MRRSIFESATLGTRLVSTFVGSPGSLLKGSASSLQFRFRRFQPLVTLGLHREPLLAFNFQVTLQPRRMFTASLIPRKDVRDLLSGATVADDRHDILLHSLDRDVQVTACSK
jgi:hypothetical protein